MPDWVNQWAGSLAGKYANSVQDDEAIPVSAPVGPQQVQNPYYSTPDDQRGGGATPFWFMPSGELIAFPQAGGTHSYHQSQMDPSLKNKTFDAYYRGRVSEDQRTVSFWKDPYYHGPERVSECVEKLKQKGLVNGKTIVSHPELYGYTVDQVIQHKLGANPDNKSDAPDMSSYSDDMRKLHVLSPNDPEKQALQKKYRINKMKVNPWVNAMRNKGFTGSSLHFPTSEQNSR